MHDITYKVSVYDKVETYKGKKVSTYYVRWRVGTKEFRQPFRHPRQAGTFRSSLMTAAKNGEAFSLTTGRPVAWAREEPEEEARPTISWYALTLDYTAVKWKYAAPNHRRSIAEALTDATEALISADSPYKRAEIRRALATWAFSGRLRDKTDPPTDTAPVLAWLETATPSLTDLADPSTGFARAIMDRISTKQAAANTANRKRAVLNNLMKYAVVERKLLAANPLESITWTRPRKLKTVDPRCVLNTEQAGRFLVAVGEVGPRGKRLKAFFGCMYYAAFRPEEAADLRDTNIINLPDSGWGEFLLTHAQPRSGSNWTDDGSVRQRGTLKHRAEGETRSVPIHPELVTLLRDHIKEFGIGPEGRIFRLPGGGLVTDRAYLAVFHQARAIAFTEIESASLLARRPYDLRHAAVSIWLKATGDPAQVAEWAGHTVDVLLRVYAKCVAGQQEQAKQRILEVTQVDAQTARIPHHQAT
jgi:integrase